MTPLRPRRALVALLLASAAPACASSRPEPTPDRPPLGCIDAPPRPLPVTPARSPEASQLVQRSLELSAAGRYLEARDAAAAAVAADPGSVAAQATLVEAMLAAGDRNEALGRAKALVESRPDEADAYYVLGRVYLAGLQAPRALEAFENAAALRPGD
ncbi:MAG: tetratricopeptide repeat protein, partial [Myxococcales bacterium]|nr:tetratricopeptide repeat protein [Myxococcales bacterium]